MFEQERDYAETLETLTEIAREVAEILDLDELLSRIAILAKRVIDYRTFGILLVNERDAGARAEGGAAVRREDEHAQHPDWRGAGRLFGTAQGIARRRGRLEGSALHQGAGRRAVGAGGAAAAEGSMPRCLRSREPRAGRFYAAARRDSRHPRQPGRRGHRERAPVRDRQGERASARARDRICAPRAERAASDGAAEAAERHRACRAVRAGAADRRRLVRLPHAGARHARRRRRRRFGQGRASRALWRIRRRACALAHVPPPVHDDQVEPRRACSRR